MTLNAVVIALAIALLAVAFWRVGRALDMLAHDLPIALTRLRTLEHHVVVDSSATIDALTSTARLYAPRLGAGVRTLVTDLVPAVAGELARAWQTASPAATPAVAFAPQDDPETRAERAMRQHAVETGAARILEAASRTGVSMTAERSRELAEELLTQSGAL